MIYKVTSVGPYEKTGGEIGCKYAVARGKVMISSKKVTALTYTADVLRKPKERRVETGSKQSKG